MVEDDGKKISTSLKKELISESDGLIMALSLPNDISDIVVPQKSMCSPKNSVKTSHVDFLRKMGMIKVFLYKSVVVNLFPAISQMMS